MLDHELSLFHDTGPLFTIEEFMTPIPDTEQIWLAPSAKEWSERIGQARRAANEHSSTENSVRPSNLRLLFRQFLDDELHQGSDLSPLHFRLLLHPLHSLLLQHRQMRVSCYGKKRLTREKATDYLSLETFTSSLGEIQELLKRWNNLAKEYLQIYPLCPIMEANMVLFHLTSLNTVTNLPEIEQLARGESVDESYPQATELRERCISNVEMAIIHCGQVLRRIRGMRCPSRPLWWPAAIYRVALVLWANALTRQRSSSDCFSEQDDFLEPANSTLAIDSLDEDHPAVIQYLSQHEGIPVLTGLGGTAVFLDHAKAILVHCIGVIDEGVPTRFGDGLRNKLERLSRG